MCAPDACRLAQGFRAARLPGGKGKPLRFANATQDADAPGWLTPAQMITAAAARTAWPQAGKAGCGKVVAAGDAAW